MPTPREDEPKDDFIDRCIPIVIEEGTAEDGAQARAVCESYWDEEQETAEMIREFTVGQFQGQFPEVPLAEGVDLEALQEDDDDPFFVTLPVARLDEVSDNGLLYDENLVNTIIEQINHEHPTGIMGHLTPDELDTSYPVPDVYWVGAKQVGDTAWAKGYVPPGKARSTLRRQKATGRKAATSIFGPPERRVKESDGTWRAEGFQLHSLDLAPYERAALKLGGHFAVTAEMEDNDKFENKEEQNNMATREEVIAELTPGDLPKAIREQIVNEWQEEHEEAKQIAELEQQVSERDQMISELRGDLDEYQREDFDASVDEAVAELVADWKVPNTDEAQERMGVLTDTVRSRVLAEMSDERDPDKIDEVVSEVWEGAKPLAEMVRDALSGPGAIVTGKGGKNWRDELAEEAHEKRVEAGI